MDKASRILNSMIKTEESNKNYTELIKNLGNGTGIDKLKGILSSSIPKDYMDDFRNNKIVQELSDKLIKELANTTTSK